MRKSNVDQHARVLSGSATAPLSPEAELVLALCRTPFSDVARRRADALLGGALDWSAVLGQAARWEVEPVALTHLLALAGDALPGAVRDEATTRNWAARARSWKLTLKLLDLLRVIEGAGISTIVLKGPAVALTAYGDVTMRSFGDLDLLVRPNDAPRVRELLVRRGYAPGYDVREEQRLLIAQHALEMSDAKTHVEIHAALLPKYLSLDLDLDAVWRESRVTACLESSIRVLAPHHLYLYLSAHGAKHRWELLRWVCDLAQVEATLDQTDVARLVATATAARARRLVALGVRVARDAFGDERAVIDADALAPAADTADLLMEARAGWMGFRPDERRGALATLHPFFPVLRYWMATRERAWDRATAVFRLLLTPSVHDAGGGSLRGLWRPVRLAAGAMGRAVR